MHFLKKTVVILCMLGLLAGCSKKVNPTQPDEGTSSGNTEKKELVFYSLHDPEAAFTGQIQAFQSTHKDIKIVYKKFQNVQEYEDLVLHELAEGRGPDIFAIRNDWLPEYQRKITPAPASVFHPEKFSETFLSAAREDLIVPDENGQELVWGVPLYIDTLALYYNKQLFRDNLPSADTPAGTWTELKEQVFGLTKTDNSIERFSVSGIAMGLAANITHFPDILSLLLIQEEADLYDEGLKKAVFAKSKGVSSGTGKAFYPVVEALKLYTSFALPDSRHTSWNLPITGLYPEQKEIGAFVRGKTAMIFGFTSAYDDIKIAIEGFSKTNEETIQLEDVGITEVPQFEGDSDTGKRDALARYYPLVVSRNSRYSAEAWEFLQFLTLPDSLNAYHEKTNKPTPRLDMVEEQSTEKLFGVFARQAPYAKTLHTVDPTSFFVIFAKLNDEIVKNKVSVEQAVQKAEKQMSCILAKRLKPEMQEDCFAL